MPTCSQAKCPIATTGVCLEGHHQGCPHLIDDDATQTEILPEAMQAEVFQPEPLETFRFHSGDKLTEREASRIMNAVPVTMVLCAGPQKAGKTTFLARIGEIFRQGAFTNFRFAGSKTLCAFEHATWFATISSGAGQPDTKRTYRAEKDTFFHIQTVLVGSDDQRFDVLITDLPGEIFPDLLSTKEVCDEQLALARADHLALFVDCGSVVDGAKRHAERDAACRFLTQVKKCRQDPSTLFVTVIFSRWDKILESCNPKQNEEYCKVLEKDIEDRFAPVFGGLFFDRIAARPSFGNPRTDAEIQIIFGRWLSVRSSVPLSAICHSHIPARDFCAFGL